MMVRGSERCESDNERILGGILVFKSKDLLSFLLAQKTSKWRQQQL